MILDTNSLPKFIPSDWFGFSKIGKIQFSNYNGESPVCRLTRHLTPDDGSHIFLKVGKEDSKTFVAIEQREFIEKFHLPLDDFRIIKGETDLKIRSIRLKDILGRQERENLLVTLISSPLRFYERKNNPENILIEMENIFDSGPISFEKLTLSFENLLDEYSKTPYEHFFELSNALLGKIYLHQNKNTLKLWLDKVLIKLSILSRNHPENASQLNLIVHEMLKTRNSILSRTLPPISFAKAQNLLPISEAFSTPLEVLQSAVDDATLKNLDIRDLTSKDSNIFPWLERFVGEDSPENLVIWKHPSMRQALAHQVLEILAYAKKEPTFFEEIFIPLMRVIDCSDNTLYNFNEMVRRKELFEAKDRPIHEVIPIFKKYFPIALIKKLGKQSVIERGKTLSKEKREKLEKEELAVVFDLLVRFKETFKFPLAFSLGRYIGSYREPRESFMTAAHLKIIMALNSNQAFLEYLASDPEWQTWLLSNIPSLNSPMNEIKEVRADSLTLLDTSKGSLSSSSYMEKLSEIDTEYNTAMYDLFLEQTTDILQKNDLFQVTR